MKTISAAEIPPDQITGRRRTGNTTRIVDWVIQRLFEGYKVRLTEPEQFGASMKSINEYLMYRVAKRLEHEHRGVKFEFDRNKRTIHLTES